MNRPEPSDSRPATAMVDHRVPRIQALFRTMLNLEIPDDETDLLEAGLLDSLGLVELLFHLEQQFGINISLEALEIDSFRTIKRIAEFVNAREGAVFSGAAAEAAAVAAQRAAEALEQENPGGATLHAAADEH